VVRLDFLARKELRSAVIAHYVENSFYRGAVIFSCGNASESLKRHLTRKPVIAIAPNGVLAPTNHWWTPPEIREVWPDYFDATSGHLPLHLMVAMVRELARWPQRFGLLPTPEPGESYIVPTGSGETILLLRWAFPESHFIPLYNETTNTAYNQNAPLNTLVEGEDRI
jgi:hypothetical protein